MTSPALLLGLALSVLASSILARGQTDIDLTGYRLTFDDEFSKLSLTTDSPKNAATWYYLPPYGPAGNYSASSWDAAACSVKDGILSVRAFQDSSGKWRSGNLSSVDSTGVGFSQHYGYFSIRAKMPDAGTGAWPAFWLMGMSSIGTRTVPNEEIDIFEWYGTSHDSVPGLVQQAAHNWNVDNTQGTGGLYSPRTKMPGGAQPWADYHIYGCLVDPRHVTWYIDGRQTNQIVTPSRYLTTPLFIMVDYALGGGWPLSGVPSASALQVDWLRVYAPPASTGQAPSASSHEPVAQEN